VIRAVRPSTFRKESEVQRTKQLICIALLLASCTGCPRDERASVKLVIEGDANLVDHLVKDVFGQLVDNPEAYSARSSRWLNGPTILTLAPVRDVERFRSCLGFGTIKKQDGRTFHLTLDPEKTQVYIALSRAVTFAKELPSYVRWELFMLRYRIKAWYSGRTVWSEFLESLNFERNR
jgi:hypothetical protein